MGVSKAVYNGKTLIDLTSDTVTETKLLSGYTAHKADGTIINGGITTKQAATYIPGTTDQVFAEDEYLYGNVVLKGDPNLLAANIKAGVTIFGVTGTYVPVEPETILSPISASNLSVARQNPTVINIGDNLVGFIGGYIKDRYYSSGWKSKNTNTNAVDFYNSSLTVTHTTLSDGNRARAAGGYVGEYGLIVGGSIYGSNSTSLSTNFNTVYSIDTSLTQNTLSNYPYSGQVGTYSDKTSSRNFAGYAIFCNSGSDSNGDIYAYNGSLTRIPMPSTSVNRKNAVFFNNKNKELVIIGGPINNTTNDRYDSSLTKLTSLDLNNYTLSTREYTVAVGRKLLIGFQTYLNIQEPYINIQWLNASYTVGEVNIPISTRPYTGTSSLVYPMMACSIGNKAIYLDGVLDNTSSSSNNIYYLHTISCNTSLTLEIESTIPLQNNSNSITYSKSGAQKTNWPEPTSIGMISFLNDKYMLLAGGMNIGTSISYHTSSELNISTVEGYVAVTE